MQPNSSDPTTDPRLRSFIEVAPDSPFPIQNLPYGIFEPATGGSPRVGVAIGDSILDLAVLADRGLLKARSPGARHVFAARTLNDFMALGPTVWRAVRARVSELLRANVPTLRDDRGLRQAAIVPAHTAKLSLPCEIPDYTDFYASKNHAANVGRIFRGPDATLPPQYLHLPIAYHGRASSVVVSGTPVRRPRGQSKPLSSGAAPEFGPTRELDIELELGFLIGVGNDLGTPIPIDEAEAHIFGVVLVNDWSARDIQQWEYQPLGPFLGKNFATTISPWVVPLAALAPFRCAGPAQEPAPLPYLRSPAERGHFDIQLEVSLQNSLVSQTNARELYWSAAQMLAHHTVNGCNLRTGDLLASGTISGATPRSGPDAPGSFGSLLELTVRGAQPIRLPDGSQRVFLEDGDEVALRGSCAGADYQIGFGECAGRILPSRAE